MDASRRERLYQLTGLIVLILSGFAAWFGAARLVSSWLSESAIELRQESSAEEAAKAARNALFWNSGDRDAKLVIAWATAQSDPAESFNHYRQLWDEFGDLFPFEDLVTFATVAQQLGNLEYAQNAVKTLLQRHEESPATLSLAAWQAFLEKRPEDGVGYLDAALDLSPEQPQANLLLGLIRIGQGSRLSEIQAKSALLTASTDPGQTGITALHLLAEELPERLLRGQLSTVADRLRNHPDATTRSRLLAATLDILREPSKAREIIEETTEALKRQDPAAVAGWLREQQLAFARSQFTTTLKTRDSLAALSVLEPVHELLAPTDPLLNDFIYLSLIEDRNTARAERLLRSAMRQYPDSHALNGTQAFALWRNGDASAAEQQLRLLNEDERNLPGIRLLNALIMADSNKPEAARNLLNNLDDDSLLTAELRLKNNLSNRLDDR